MDWDHVVWNIHFSSGQKTDRNCLATTSIQTAFSSQQNISWAAVIFLLLQIVADERDVSICHLAASGVKEHPICLYYTSALYSLQQGENNWKTGQQREWVEETFYMQWLCLQSSDFCNPLLTSKILSKQILLLHFPPEHWCNASILVKPSFPTQILNICYAHLTLLHSSYEQF